MSELLREAETDADLGDHRSRFAVDGCRLVQPLFHGIDRGGRQLRGPADQSKFLNGAILGDNGVEPTTP